MITFAVLGTSAAVPRCGIRHSAIGGNNNTQAKNAREQSAFIAVMAGNLKCQICSTFYSLTIALMLSHLCKVHVHDPDFFVRCDVPGCQRTFRNVNTYKSHLRRTHREVDLHDEQVLAVDDAMDIAEHVEDSERTDVEMIDLTTENVHQSDEENLYDRLEDRNEANKRLNALYLLSTKESNLLTQKALDGIVDGTTALVRNTVELVKRGVQNRLDSAGIDFDAVPGLEDLFAEGHEISNPFSHVATKHKQAAFYAENFGLVVSCCYFIKLLSSSILIQ